VSSPGGVLTQNVQSAPALPLSMQRRRERDALLAQEDDMSAIQAYGRQQGEAGQTAMLNALAAQFAGERFEPVQTQFLRRAAAAQHPMRVGKGMVTPDGQYIVDPGAKREAQIARLSGEIELADRLEAQAASQAERLAAQRDIAANRDMNSREMAQLRSDTQQLIASMRQPGGASRPASAGEAVPVTPATPPAPPTAQIIKPDINPATAMGLGGRVRSTWNKIGDMVNAGDPQEANRQATEQLSALANATRTTLQDAVPGRPSNYLVQLFDQQAIRPNELMTGAATAQARIQAVKGFLANGLDAQRQVLTSANATPAAKATAELKVNQIQQLIAEYDALSSAFNRPAAASAGAFSDPEKERRYQEWKRQQGGR